MRRPLSYLRRAAVLAALSLCSGGLAQEDGAADSAGSMEMGLDLTQEGIGLDLSADIREKRPRVALLGVAWTGEEAPSDEDDARRARLEASWAADARRRGYFSRLVTPADAASALSSNYASALGCQDADCFSAYAETLEVDRLLVGRLRREGNVLKLSTVAFDLGTRRLDAAENTLGGAAREVERRGAAELAAVSKRASQEMAALKVKVTPPEARVVLGEEDLGTGDIDRNVSAGTRRLRVEAADYERFEETYTLAPGELQELTVELTPKPPPPVEQYSDADLQLAERRSARGGGSLLKRPGFYVAAAGAAAAAVGLVMGLQAKTIEKRAVDDDGDGILDVTLKDADAARNRAKMANILLGAGGAAAVGGVTWLLVAPSPSVDGSGGGVTLTVGGEF